MKNAFVAISFVVIGLSVSAAVTSDATFGVLKVTSPAPEVSLSVPWVSAADCNTSVAVKDFVKTSNLVKESAAGKIDGDTLLKYNDETGVYCGWFLNYSGNWEGYAVTITNHVYAAQDNATLDRGDALILFRVAKDPSTGEARSLSGDNGDIYLYGQYKAAAGVHISITRGAEGKVTLFAPVNCSAAGFNLNDYDWANAVTGDQIRLQYIDDSGNISVDVWEYDNAQDAGYKWGREGIKNPWITSGATIRAGEGGWYISKAGSGTITATVRD